MRVYTLVALCLVVVMTLDAIVGCEGWFGGSRSGSSSRRSSSPVSRTRTRTSSTRRGGGFWGGRSRSSRTTSVRRTSTSSTRRNGGFWKSSRRTTSTYHRRIRSKPKPVSKPKFSIQKTDRGTTIKVGGRTIHTRNFGKIRDRDETGHRTGLGTLTRKMFKQPVKTVKAIMAFGKSYNEMRKKNVIGGNLNAHRKANKDATRVSDAKTAGAISAVREQYKNFRVKKNRDGSFHIGDTRTKKERDSTMNANKQGRQDACKDNP